MLFGIQKRNVHFNLLKPFKDFKILIHFFRGNQPLRKRSRDRIPFNFIWFRLKDLIIALYFGRFILFIAFRNIFFNDFSITKSSYRFKLTHFIFIGTTIVNTKLTLGVWLWLRWKLPLFYCAHGCGQFSESAPNVIYGLWVLIINGGLSLHELL